MAFVLGVTGGIGSGKTAATDRFATHGIKVVDADEIARKVVDKHSPALNAIVEHFGPSILQRNGELNRTQLREIIFSQAKEKEWLENLLHPLIRKTIKKELQQSPNSAKYAILSAPLLLEGELHSLTDRVLIIDCEETTQLTRASQRDNTKEEAIKKIMQQQLSRSERIAKADDIINNDGSLNELHQAVDNYHLQLLKDIT